MTLKSTVGDKSQRDPINIVVEQLKRCWLLLLLGLMVCVPAFGQAEDGIAVDEPPIIRGFGKALSTDLKGSGAITAPQRRTLEGSGATLYDAVPQREVSARGPFKLKVFVPPVSASMPYGVAPGLTAKQRQEIDRRWKVEHSLSKWLAQLNKIASSVHEPILLNNTVSYIVSFDGKNDVGVLQLSRGGTDAANIEALRIIRAITPFPAPLDDSPYRRGLMFRFTSRRLEVELAPRRGDG